MARTTSFTLGEDLDAYVREKVESGAFASVSEVLREALRRMAEEDLKEKTLMAALDTGLASKPAKPGVWERVDAKVRHATKKR